MTLIIIIRGPAQLVTSVLSMRLRYLYAAGNLTVSSFHCFLNSFSEKQFRHLFQAATNLEYSPQSFLSDFFQGFFIYAICNSCVLLLGEIHEWLQLSQGQHL